MYACVCILRSGVEAGSQSRDALQGFRNYPFLSLHSMQDLSTTATDLDQFKLHTHSYFDKFGHSMNPVI